MDLLVLDAAPQALDKHVVPPSRFAVHADRNSVAGEHAGEGPTGELRALVRVEDVRLPAIIPLYQARTRAEPVGMSIRHHGMMRSMLSAVTGFTALLPHFSDAARAWFRPGGLA
jgi:hypothetical protein